MRACECYNEYVTPLHACIGRQNGHLCYQIVKCSIRNILVVATMVFAFFAGMQLALYKQRENMNNVPRGRKLFRAHADKQANTSSGRA